MGLGIAGGAVEDALFFVRQGAQVTVTDLKQEQDLERSVRKLQNMGVVFHLGGHQKQDFIDADLIIQNPGVAHNSPYLQIARENNIPIEMGIGVFVQQADMSNIIGVTGTKGKSTTSALIHRVLQLKYPDAYHGGDVDGSPLKFLEQNQQGALGVLELSSWRLEGMKPYKKSPHIGVITNIEEDHLNRYENYQAYKDAKKILVEFQNQHDIAILNYDDEDVREIAHHISSRVIWFSNKHKPIHTIGESGC